MASTVIRGAQIKDSTVQRHDLDTSTVGQAVVTKLVQGSGVTLSSTGADSGTGDVTVSTSAIPLASSSTSGLMNQTSGNTTDFIDGTNASQPLQPVIWSVRLRSFNAVGNPTFEVDQINCGNAVANANAKTIDRWGTFKVGTPTLAVSAQQLVAVWTSPIVVPGTNFVISNNYFRVTLTTQQASLGTGDVLQITQNVEGPRFRELSFDVHSMSLLVRSSVAGLKFGLSLRDMTPGKSLSKLCTIPSANTWTLITLPNLPVWPSTGSFGITAGAQAFYLGIVLAAGSSLTNSANDIFTNSNTLGALGQDNFASKPVNSTFDVAFVQHEPGALCTTPIDCPFTQNLDDCLRYFCKSYSYGVIAGTNTFNGCNPTFLTGSSSSLANGYAVFPKPMAKSPSPTAIYNPTGAQSQAYDLQAGTAIGLTGVSNIGDRAITQISSSAAFVAGHNYAIHYTADTGW